MPKVAAIYRKKFRAPNTKTFQPWDFCRLIETNERLFWDERPRGPSILTVVRTAMNRRPQQVQRQGRTSQNRGSANRSCNRIRDRQRYSREQPQGINIFASLTPDTDMIAVK